LVNIFVPMAKFRNFYIKFLKFKNTVWLC